MNPNHPSTIGIVATSSVVPPVEFKLGLDTISDELVLPLKVHPVWKKKTGFFSGSDEERAQAFYEYALDPEIPVIWCARGGYGAYRLLPHIMDLEAKRGKPPTHKLIIGFSDNTVLLQHAMDKWGWCALHAPMVAAKSLIAAKKSFWHVMRKWIAQEKGAGPWEFKPLKALYLPQEFKNSGKPITFDLIGGNLALWSFLQGTPFQPTTQNKALFFEEISESLNRVDRLVEQLLQAGQFEGVKAILLGDFVDCHDRIPKYLKTTLKEKHVLKAFSKPKPTDLAPLRPALSLKKGLQTIFGRIGEIYQIPVFAGLRVGHEAYSEPLPLGATYQLNPQGRLHLSHWDWLDSET